MIKSSRTELDEVDELILGTVQQNGRISNAELARHISLSPPAAHARLRRLEQQGFIREYVAHLDREQLGYDLLCFIQISLMVHQQEHVYRFRNAVEAMQPVLECHHITGEFDYLLKVVLQNRADLEQFVVNQLTPLPGVARIYTSLVLTEVKATTNMPVPKEQEAMEVKSP
ncbi:MAG: Lrp/AsnC family transcriptional regulator [Chloroflexi bacterium]|nr:Lrp/AsnC family transcriptional regulator [Chloroflexota bacterium]